MGFHPFIIKKVENMISIKAGTHKTIKIVELIRSSPLWKLAVDPKRYHTIEIAPIKVLNIQTALVKIDNIDSSKVMQTVKLVRDCSKL